MNVERGEIRRARSAVFAAEDAIDVAVLALTGIEPSDTARSELIGDLRTVQHKTQQFMDRLQAPLSARESPPGPAAPRAGSPGAGGASP